jgi:hypothetical protein
LAGIEMTSYNFGSDKDQVIFLKPTEVLEAENIVIQFVATINGAKKASGGFIELRLNATYRHKVIVSDIYPDNWTKTINRFKTRAEEKGISKKHIDMITDVLDNNAGKLIKQISDEQELVGERTSVSRREIPVIMALAMVKSKTVELFLDQVKKPFIAIKQDDYTTVMPIHSRTFGDWVTATYYFEARQAEHSAAAAEAEVEKRSDSHDDNEDKTKVDPETGIHHIDHSKYPDEDDKGGRPLLGGRRIMSSILKDDDVAKVQTILTFEAEKQAVVKELFVRAASFVDTSPQADLDSNVVYYDLCNKHWDIIKVTRHGWSVEKNYPQSLFKRYPTMNEQFMPSRDYPPDILEQFMKLTNVYDDPDNNLLAKVYMISLLLLANLPKPVMVPHGTHGSGKSTFQEFVKRVVDPAAALTSAFPNNLAELVMQLDHNYLTFFDNISEIKPLTSDAICRAVTGSGFVKRTLYKDDEDFVYNMKRAVGFNGINVTATRPDLLDRVINLLLNPIEKRKRRKVAQLQSEFDRLLPQLLGYICDTIVKVLGRIGEVKLQELPRMADFAEMGELVARCIGCKAGEFTAAYNRNIGFTNEQAIEASPVATAIIELMEQNAVWTGKASGLKVALNDLIASRRELASMVYSKSWPKSPRALRDRLNEIEPNLKEVGITISYQEDKHAKSSTIIIVNNNYFTLEQIFWATFVTLEEAEAKNPANITQADKSTVGGDKLRQALISSGRFDKQRAIDMINAMVDNKSLEVPMQDTYRRRAKK